MVWKWSLFNSYFPAFQWNSEAFCVFLKTCNSSSVDCTFSPRAWSPMTCDLIFIDVHWYWRLIFFSEAWLSPPFTQGLCHMEILHFNVFAMFSPCLCGLCLLFLISERLHSQSNRHSLLHFLLIGSRFIFRTEVYSISGTRFHGYDCGVGIYFHVLLCGKPTIPNWFVWQAIHSRWLEKFPISDSKSPHLCGSVLGFSTLLHWPICTFLTNTTLNLIIMALWCVDF